MLINEFRVRIKATVSLFEWEECTTSYHVGGVDVYNQGKIANPL